MLGGGAERQLAYLAAELVKRGWETHVALTKEGPNFSRLTSHGVIVHRLSCSGNYDPRLATQVFSLIRQIDPDVVQTWLPQMDVAGGIACLSSRTPWVLSERSSGFGYGNGPKARVRRFLGYHSKVVVANSTSALAYWQNGNPRDLPVRSVIANIVPLDEIDNVKPATQVGGFALNGEQWVIYAGRLQPGKNVLTLLLALELVAQNSKAKALICGDGLLRAEMEAYIRNRRLGDKLVMCGYVHDLYGLLKRSNAFVSLSNYEGSPNAVLEAMGCRCPIVVSDIPGHRELLDDASAAFVPGTIPEIAAAAILKILQGGPAVSSRVDRARLLVMDHKAERIAEQYEDVYQLVTGAGGTPIA